MKTLVFLMISFYSFAQTSYTNGQDGIEMFAVRGDTMYVYHQRQAKMEVRIEVALIVLNNYLRSKNTGGVKVICTSLGEVTGILTIKRTPKMVVLYFQYMSILWNSGILEKTLKKKKK